MDEVSQAEMVQYQVQDKLSDAENYDISQIDILLHYWKYSNGIMMVEFSGFCGLGDDAIKLEDVKIDYPDTLSIILQEVAQG